MKLALFLALMCIMQVNATVYSQSINLEINDLSLRDALKEIESKSSYRFFYSDDLLFLDRKITLVTSNSKVEDVLNDLFSESQLTYRIFDNKLIIIAPREQGEIEISGTVKDAGTDEPIPGVNIIVEGTTLGVVTDVNGKYSLTVSSDAILVFSFIGYNKERISVQGQTVIDVKLVPDVKSLDEVVVIGYGVQKKKLNTGATLNIKGEQLQKLNTTNALQALQGQTPGVQITSTSGQPGEAMKVTVRGLGTIGKSKPLYIVDGVATDKIDYLNNADIESIDVLKDAASAAIYGSRGANGVVLVTTKQGKAGKAQVTFDGYVGIQNVPKKFEMLNAKEYATIMNEQAVNSGKLPYFSNSVIENLPDTVAGYGYLANTNWINEMFVKNAKTQNYTLGVQGGNEITNYSTSLSYTQQAGIIGGRNQSNYERYGVRVNSEHKLYKDVLKVGEHMTFAYMNKNGIQVGGIYSNTLREAFNTNPFIPVYDTLGNFYSNKDSKWTGGTHSNPYALMVFNNQNKEATQKLLGDVYFELTPLKNLRYRSSFGIDYYSTQYRAFKPYYELNIYPPTDSSKITQKMTNGLTWTWDNLITYQMAFNAHHVEVMAGISALEYNGSELSASNNNSSFNSLDYAYLINANNSSEAAKMSLLGKPFDNKLLSYFGRINYNYKETYMLNVTFRMDGSSKFAKGHQWGYFPSVSGGWTLTNESFFDNLKQTVTFLKLRASWGQNGNQDIDPYQYLATIMMKNTNYVFGNKEGVLTSGAYPNRLGNPDLKWETSEQIDVGFDASFIKDKLTANFDWYNKKTKDWLIVAPILATAGADAPFINGGNVINKGIEAALGWRDRLGDFNYSVNANIAYNKNEVQEIPTNDGIVHGSANLVWNNSPEVYRAESGKPIGYFWGYKTLGVFQNEDEVRAYTYSDGTLIQPNAKPGDLKYFDATGNGGITKADKVMIGDPIPDYVFGFNVAFDYKGVDFSITTNGVAGNQIVQSYRNQADQYANYPKSFLSRWHGEGSSNKIPRLTENAANFTEFSDIYIHDGDFLRISNVTLGYDVSKLFKKRNISQMRVYIAAQNLFTFTKYDGMDPEVGYGNDGGATDQFSSGLDLGYYPRPRTFMIGFNVKF